MFRVIYTFLWLLTLTTLSSLDNMTITKCITRVQAVTENINETNEILKIYMRDKFHDI
jgi:hypothetical protein